MLIIFSPGRPVGILSLLANLRFYRYDAFPNKRILRLNGDNYYTLVANHENNVAVFGVRNGTESMRHEMFIDTRRPFEERFGISLQNDFNDTYEYLLLHTGNFDTLVKNKVLSVPGIYTDGTNHPDTFTECGAYRVGNQAGVPDELKWANIFTVKGADSDTAFQFGVSFHTGNMFVRAWQAARENPWTPWRKVQFVN